MMMMNFIVEEHFNILNPDFTKFARLFVFNSHHRAVVLWSDSAELGGILN